MIDFKEKIAEEISKKIDITKEELKEYLEIPKDSKMGDYAKFGKKKEDIIGDNGLIKDTTYFTDGIYDDYDIRMQAYWTYLSGAAGYTYGNNAIWQMYKPGGISCTMPHVLGWCVG